MGRINLGGTALGAAPVEPPRERRELAPAEEVLRIRAHVETLDAMGIIGFALSRYRNKIAVISSFGSESAVLLHMVAQIDPTTPVIFLNTGKLFGETMRYRDRLQETLGLSEIRAIGPHPDDLKLEDREGTLWSREPDLCCKIRKILPVRRALKGFSAQITGRKRFQTASRAALLKAELIDGRICFNPLTDWTLQDLQGYRETHHLPKHPLNDDGYLSIGCLPCTKRVAAGEDYRAGRWQGLDKDECGIHSGVDGDGT
nr:MAG: phosphoadenylyl-sulfate reductase [Hyphomicrobiales bacterium]